MSHSFETPLQKLKQRQPMENWQELKQQVDNIDNDVKALKQSLGHLNEMVVEIRTAIRGNVMNPTGLGQMVEDHEKRLTDLEATRQRNQFSETIFKIVGGAGLGAITVKIIESLVK